MRRVSGVLIGLALCAGCSAEYSVRTTIRADGSVARVVDQPATSFPASARSGAGWASVRVDEPQPQPDRRETNFEPARERARAEGTFPSADAIPDHLVVEAAGRPEPGRPRPASRLVRDVGIEDHVLISARTYRETLTDVVTPEGARAARAELLAVAGELLEAAAVELAGREYDVSDLVTWLRAEGRPWADELTAAALQAASLKGRLRYGDQSPGKEFWVAAARASIRRGLDLSDGHGGVLRSQEELDQRLVRFAQDLLVRTVRRTRDGRPIDRADADRLLALLLAPFRGDEGKKDDPATERTRAAVDRAVGRVAERRGGREAAGDRFNWLGTQVAGVYGLQWMTTHRFEFSLKVPGVVVRTDGELVDDDEVRWRLTGGEAWPSGYDMTCRYVQPDEPLQRKLLGGVRVATRRQVTAYLALLDATDTPESGPDGVTARVIGAVGGGPATKPEPPAVVRRPLREVLLACRSAGSMDPLRRHLREVQAAGPVGGRAAERCTRMMELLDVTP